MPVGSKLAVMVGRGDVNTDGAAEGMLLGSAVGGTVGAPEMVGVTVGWGGPVVGAALVVGAGLIEGMALGITESVG